MSSPASCCGAEVRAARPGEWARLPVSRFFCFVHTVAGGAAQTGCRGRWGAAEPVEVVETVSSDDACTECAQSALPAFDGAAVFVARPSVAIGGAL